MIQLVNKLYYHLFDKLELYIGSKEVSSRIIRGSSWLIFGGILTRSIGLIGGILLARSLREEDFGGYSIVVSTMSIFGLFSGSAMGMTAIKYVSEYLSKGDNRKVNDIVSLVFSISVFVSVFFGALLFYFSDVISADVLANSKLKLPIRIMAFSLVFSSINGALNGILSGFENFKSISILNIKYGIINYPLIICFTSFWGLNGAILGYALSLFILSILTLHSLKRTIKNKYNLNFDLTLFKKYNYILTNYTLPAIIAGALTAPITWLSNVIFVNSADGYSQTGIFQAGNQLIQLVIFSLVRKKNYFKDLSLSIFIDCINY